MVSWAPGKTLSPLLPFPYGATDTDHESQQSAIKKTVQCYKSEGLGVWGCPRRRSVSWDLKGQRFCWWGRAWHPLKDLTAFSPSREVSRVDWNARHKTGLRGSAESGCVAAAVLVLKVALQMLLLVILRAPGAPDAKTLPGGCVPCVGGRLLCD